jgi:hypothetical protein
VNVVRWWAIFGFTLFLLITLSFVHWIFVFAELPVYFVGCALAVLSLVKMVKASLDKNNKKTKSEKPVLTMEKPKLVLKQCEERKKKNGAGQKDYLAWLENQEGGERNE